VSTNQIAQMHAVLCPPRIGVDQTTANMTPDEAKHEYENRRVHHVIEQKYLNYLRPLKNLHDGLRRPTNNILKQLKFMGDGISTMLPAAATDIVADVRAKVQAVFAANSPGVSIQLTFGDIELRDGYTEAAASTDGPRHNTLGEYGVPNKATIAVVVTRPLANISVKQRGQNAITLNVEASNTIEDVKYKIQEATEIAPDQQELTIGKVALTDDNQTLSQAGVKQDSTLQLRKCNKGIGNGPVDSRMENRTEPRGCQQTFSKP
jgi:hypothetical protein